MEQAIPSDGRRSRLRMERRNSMESAAVCNAALNSAVSLFMRPRLPVDRHVLGLGVAERRGMRVLPQSGDAGAEEDHGLLSTRRRDNVPFSACGRSDGARGDRPGTRLANGVVHHARQATGAGRLGPYRRRRAGGSTAPAHARIGSPTGFRRAGGIAESIALARSAGCFYASPPAVPEYPELGAQDLLPGLTRATSCAECLRLLRVGRGDHVHFDALSGEAVFRAVTACAVVEPDGHFDIAD